MSENASIISKSIDKSRIDRLKSPSIHRNCPATKEIVLRRHWLSENQHFQCKRSPDWSRFGADPRHSGPAPPWTSIRWSGPVHGGRQSSLFSTPARLTDGRWLLIWVVAAGTIAAPGRPPPLAHHRRGANQFRNYPSHTSSVSLVPGVWLRFRINGSLPWLLFLILFCCQLRPPPTLGGRRFWVTWFLSILIIIAIVAVIYWRHCNALISN